MPLPVPSSGSAEIGPALELLGLEAVADEVRHLLDEGVVDSTGVLEVIGFLESEFGLVIEDADITPENFDSIARIAAFVSRKCG